MSDKINIQEILVKHCGDWFLQGEKEGILDAFKEALGAVLLKVAYEGKATADWHRGRYTGDATIDKESILNIEKEIDYE